MMSSPVWTLGIETATSNCSVGLFRNGQWVDGIDEDSGKPNHSEQLHPLIQKVLEGQGLRPGDLSAVAIGLGPGSYTGLRIGASTAKGIAFALQIPVIGISTLQLLTEGVAGKRVDAVLDARRMEVYTAAYNADEGVELLAPCAKIIDETYLQEIARTDSPATIVGDCTEKMRNLLGEERFNWVEKKPSAKDMGRLIEKAWSYNTFLDAAAFEPTYVKPYRAIISDKGRLQSLRDSGNTEQ